MEVKLEPAIVCHHKACRPGIHAQCIKSSGVAGGSRGCSHQRLGVQTTHSLHKSLQAAQRLEDSRCQRLRLQASRNGSLPGRSQSRKFKEGPQGVGGTYVSRHTSYMSCYEFVHPSSGRALGSKPRAALYRVSTVGRPASLQKRTFSHHCIVEHREAAIAYQRGAPALGEPMLTGMPVSYTLPYTSCIGCRNSSLASTPQMSLDH